MSHQLPGSSNQSGQVRSSPALMLACVLCCSVAGLAQAKETAEFSKSNVYIEINSSDGDAGFHALIDADAWHEVTMRDTDGHLLLKDQAKGRLKTQGLTEKFFESAEPVCTVDPEEPDGEVVPLAVFLARFPEGDYPLSGKSNEGIHMAGSAELTHDIPAAPDASAMEDAEFEIDEVLVEWAAGTDLGESCHDQTLVDLGIIPDPATVTVVAWELTIEPDADEIPEPKRTLNVLLPPGQTSFEVPEEFLAEYVADGYTEFKFEVGAREAGGNRIYTEGGFEIDAGE